MTTEQSRKVLIVSASIGTGHMQAARAIEEYWQLKEPQAVISHVDFLDTETLSVEHLIKGTYIKMIDVFPMLYDMIYRVSKGGKERNYSTDGALLYIEESYVEVNPTRRTGRDRVYPSISLWGCKHIETPRSYRCSISGNSNRL